MENNIEFNKIDKISDDVYSIGPNVVLKFNTSLSRINSGKRYHYHKEYEYPSKIDDAPSLVTIKRTFDYYLSIENNQKEANGEKLFIRIGPAEYYIFKKGLEEAIAWFTDTKYAKLFTTNRGQLVLMPPIPEFKISNLPMGKYIHLSPTIIDRGMPNMDKEPGVRIELSSPSYYIEISVDRLMGLYYTINTFNMYQCALSMVNYLGRPEFGTNRYVMETTHTLPAHDPGSVRGVTGIEGRFVTPKGNTSIESLER